MSHSKITKRGRSHYLEAFNPKAKQYIVSCTLCGRQGFKPSVLNDDYVTPPVFKENRSRMMNRLERRVIRSELQSVLPPLELDDNGYCSDCANKTNEEQAQQAPATLRRVPRRG